MNERKIKSLVKNNFQKHNTLQKIGVEIDCKHAKKIWFKKMKCCVCCNNQNFDKHQKPEMALWYLGFSDMITCRVSQCKALNDLELSLCLFRVDSLNFDLKDVVSQTCFTVLRNGRLATCRELSRDKHICETL